MPYQHLADCGYLRYNDNEYEYRHVQIPKAMLKAIPKEYLDPSKGTLKLLWEDEWRAIGITQVGSKQLQLRGFQRTGHLTRVTELGMGTL